MSKIYHLEPKKSFEALPTGEYVLTLKEWREVVEEQDTQFSKKGDVRLEFHWNVAVPGGEDTDRKDWCSVAATANEKTKLLKIAAALRVVDLDRAMQDGCDLNPDLWTGRSCVGTIVRKQKDDKSLTDSIVSYAPTSNVVGHSEPGSNGPSKVPLSNAIAKRLQDLLTLTDGDFVGLPANMTGGQMATMMREVGAQALTQTAKRNLADMRDMASMLAVQLPDELCHEPATNKDGLLQLDAIQKLIDAAGNA